MQSPGTALLEQAIALHRQGAIDEAAHGYEQVLSAEPQNAMAHTYLAAVTLQRGDPARAAELAGRGAVLAPQDGRAHRLLGQALQALGRGEDALASFDRAVAVAPDMAEAHGGRADVLVDLGRLAEAVESFDRAIALQPESVGDWFNRGATLHDLNRHEEALASFDRVIALEPNFAEAHFNRANSLARVMRYEEAVDAYDRALGLQGHSAEALNNRGLALKALNRTDEARASFQQALAVQPEHPDALYNMAQSLIAANQRLEAVALLIRTLELKPTLDAKLALADCVCTIPPQQIAPELEPWIARMLTEGWISPGVLSHQASALIKQHPMTASILERMAVTPDAALDASDLARMAHDPLLNALLPVAPVCDADLEKLLTRLRRVAVDLALSPQAGSVSDTTLSFCCALAQQCFVNDYVFSIAQDEIRLIGALASRIDTMTSADSIPPLWLAALGACQPLHDTPVVRSLLRRPWPAPVQNLLKVQVEEVDRERSIRGTIPALTPISQGVSEQVRQQYEEMPYPRWVLAPSLTRSKPLETYLRDAFPFAPFRSLDTGSAPTTLLVAGCGTGRHPIWYSKDISECEILAVDLSLASLSYGRRKAEELGINNIEFAQADIVHLPTLGRTFDVIDSSGVLHHLGDPLAGWRGLLSMLRPGGFMRVGLYSAAGRAPVNMARQMIADRGYRPTAHDIREFRQEVMAHPDPQLRTLLWFIDFFSVSECRDLLFHVQEQQMTLSDISAFLIQQNLFVVGFVVDASAAAQYRMRFPDDPAMADLANWHTLEMDNPMLFAGMYNFWVQKPAD